MADLSETLGRLTGALEAVQRHQTSLERLPERLSALEALRKNDKQEFDRDVQTLFNELRKISDNLGDLRQIITIIEGRMDTSEFQSQSVDESLLGRIKNLEDLSRSTSNRWWDIVKMIISSGIGATVAFIAAKSL